jgi:hypothetical protein
MRIKLTHATQTDTNDAPKTSSTTIRPGLSRVRTGLSVAALAGVIVATGGATTGLGHSINALANPNDTTCCGASTSSSSV